MTIEHEHGKAAQVRPEQDDGPRMADDGDKDAIRDARLRNDEVAGRQPADDTRAEDRDMSDAAVRTYGMGIGEREAGREPATSGETGEISGSGPLLPDDELDRIRGRWHELQHGFVDDPRHAVDDAAELVSLAANRVMSTLGEQVASLEVHRSRNLAGDGELYTEELRTLMRSYRELLDRLLVV